MKVIPIALQAEIDKPTARLARGMWIRRRDGQEYGFTTARVGTNNIGDGVFYRPAYSFTPTDISSGSDLDADDMEMQGILQLDTITEDDVRAGRWDYAEFRTFRYNWASPSDGVIKDRAGHVGKISVNAATFRSEMLGLMEAYTVGIVKVTQPGCRTSLGTAECSVTPDEVTGTVESTTTDAYGAVVSIDSARTEADGFFNEGVITFDFSSGPLAYEVKTYTVGQWTTKTPVAYDTTGIAYTMTEGCQRRFQEDCVERFDNAINFRGEPWLRGPDALAQVGRR